MTTGHIGTEKQCKNVGSFSILASLPVTEIWHWLMSWGGACQRVCGDMSFTCRTQPAQREGATWIHPLWDPTTCRRSSRGPLCYRCLGANWLQEKPCLGRGKSWQLWLDCCPWIWVSRWKTDMDQTEEWMNWSTEDLITSQNQVSHSSFPLVLFSL